MKRKDITKIYSRNDLLKWINETLSTNCSKIQELGTGTIYCLLINHYHPNTIYQHNINKHPNSEYEFINNFKLLISAFNKLKISKNIIIQKLVKMKYKQNCELISWMYYYFSNSQNLQSDINQQIFRTPSVHDSLNKKRNYIQFSFEHQRAALNFQSTKNVQNKIKSDPIHLIASMSSTKGKSSVSQQVFQNNYLSVIQRIKQILVRPEMNNQKIKQLKMLLNVRESSTLEVDDEIKDLINDEKESDDFLQFQNGLLLIDE